MGNEYVFQGFAEQNVATLNEAGATKIVASCPHCFNTLANEYPDFGGRYEVVHHTELLAELVRDGKLAPAAGDARITYHDSCYLARHNDVLAAPRELVAAAGQPVEMQRSGKRTFCCGAGGAHMWLEERGSAINEERVREAAETGAETLAVACPFCTIMLDDGVRQSGRELRVADVVHVAGRGARPLVKKRDYDVVIVGGGSAGCVLANRLSADPSTSVLVLEAGRPDSLWDVYVHMPAALSFPIGSKRYDWRYASEPEPFMHGRRIAHARGKLLGGSSSINGMIFQRGNPLDYEKWAAEPGLEGWDYAHCLPYFKRMETCVEGADEYRGGDGPLVVERGPATNPLFAAFFEAVQQAGYSLTTDVNGSRQEGFARFDRNIRRGAPAQRRARVPASGHEAPEPRGRLPRARHARALRGDARGGGGGGDGRTRRAGARPRGDPLRRRDQFAAAPPAVRGRSPEHLESVGVDVVHELPASARTSRTTSRCTSSTRAHSRSRSRRPMKWRNRPWVGFRWLFFRDGPGATNHFEGGGFVRSNDDVAYPNLMFHFLPLAIRYDGTQPAGGHGYQVHVGPMNSDARGTLRITSSDPRAHPALRFNYLSTEQDRREWVEAIACARHILGQPAFSEYDGARSHRGRRCGPTRRCSTGSHATPRPRSIRPVRAAWGWTSWRSSTRRRCASAGSTGFGSSTRR